MVSGRKLALLSLLNGKGLPILCGQQRLHEKPKVFYSHAIVTMPFLSSWVIRRDLVESPGFTIFHWPGCG
jgi:hypothetical protein